MDVINILPSPPHFFRLFFRLAASLLHSTLNTSRRRLVEQRVLQTDFDIASDCGFFPPQQLKRLPHAFNIWEDALAEASDKLTLGDDDRDEANEKRPLGEAWRAAVREVCGFIQL